MMWPGFNRLYYVQFYKIVATVGRRLRRPNESFFDYFFFPAARVPEKLCSPTVRAGLSGLTGPCMDSAATGENI